LRANDFNGNPACLVFHADTIQRTNVEYSIMVNIDPHFGKALPSKIDYESLSPYFAYRPHDIIQHTLRQTTLLAKSTIHYPMRRHLKSRLQMFEPILYLDPVSKFPETTKWPGYFVGFVDNVGDTMKFKILKKDLSTVLHRSVVRSAADANH
jgi:hypothetical protein